MKTKVYFCTQTENKEGLEQRYGKYHILKSQRLQEAEFIGKYSNRESLPKVYNSWLESQDCNVVLVHDDVVIRDPNWIEKIEEGLKKYDVLGLAGASDAKIAPPCLWHLMCSPESRRGVVTHVAENGKDTFVTNFGKQGRVLILDGLFLAFNANRIKEAGVKFDASNPCIAHFYDIDFSLTCNSKKLKLGTVNIDAVHNSHGLKKFTDEWLSGQAWFMQKVADGKYEI